MKTLFLFTLLSAFGLTGYTQTASHDSLVRATAYQDTKHFKLNLIDLKKFRKAGKNAGSDFFKPNSGNTADTALLRDSVYVKAFRTAAYEKTRKRRTTGHWVLIGGGIYTGIVIVASIAVLITLGSKLR